MSNFKGVLAYLDGRISAYETAIADLRAVKTADIDHKVEAYDRALCSVKALKQPTKTKSKRGRKPKSVIIDSTSSSPKKGWNRCLVDTMVQRSMELKHRIVQNKTKTCGFSRSIEGISLAAVKEALVGLLMIANGNGVTPKSVYSVLISDPRVTPADLEIKTNGLSRLMIKLLNAKRLLLRDGIIRDLGNARTGMVGKGNRWALATK